MFYDLYMITKILIQRLSWYLGSVKCRNCQFKPSIKVLKVVSQWLEPQIACPRCGQMIVVGKSRKPTLNKFNPTISRKITTLSFDGGFEIKVPWLLADALGILTVGTGFVGGGILGLYERIINRGTGITFETILISLLFFAGIKIVHIGAKHLVTKTIFRVTADRLEVWSEPLVFDERKTFLLSEIKNFSIERSVILPKVAKRRQGFFHKKKCECFLSLDLKNGWKKRLLKTKDVNEALYIEKLLQDHLGIPDDPSLDQINV